MGDLFWGGEVQTIIQMIELVGHAAVNIVRPVADKKSLVKQCEVRAKETVHSTVVLTKVENLTSRVLVCEYSTLVTREPGVGGEEALQTLRGPLHYLSSDRAEVGGGGGCWRCTQGCDHQAQADQLEKWRHPS